jgi:hypothetical protein
MPAVQPLVKYYADDANIPCSSDEQQAFFKAAREVLLDQIVIYRREIANLMAASK